MEIDVYLGLGGNIGDTSTVIRQALQRIQALPGVDFVDCAPFYLTSPISSIPQGMYVNTVCALTTQLDCHELARVLRTIEADFGKDGTRKNAPRVLDIDILFYGNIAIESDELCVPHPRWRERLFVLAPLADLTNSIELPNGEWVDILELIETFPHANSQWVGKVELDESRESQAGEL